jgi:hypothetical protein
MSAFLEQLRLAEKAAENIYFAERDRRLIEALHKRMQKEGKWVRFCPPAPGPEQKPSRAS